jgi:CDGSH-type Zn-finger protein
MHAVTFPAREERRMSFKVVVRNNGPLRLEGEDITIVDEAGRGYHLSGRTVVSLCRCGQSATKPFCDGSHNRVGFQSQCEAYELPAPKPKV